MPWFWGDREDEQDQNLPIILKLFTGVSVFQESYCGMGVEVVICKFYNEPPFQHRSSQPINQELS